LKKTFFIVLAIICCSKLNAQQKNFSWDNVSYGGGITLGFGSGTTVGLAPNAVYNFGNGLSAGLGIGYLYSEFDNFSTSAFNLSVISFYQTPYEFQLSAEFEQYFATQKNSFDEFSTNFPALHLGIAYNLGKFAVGIRYDVLYNENKSIFASPISPIARFYF
jgi:hypothetical protein